MAAFGVITQAKTCPRRQHSQRDMSRGGLKERSASRGDTLTAPPSFLVSVLFCSIPMRAHLRVSALNKWEHCHTDFSSQSCHTEIHLSPLCYIYHCSWERLVLMIGVLSAVEKFHEVGSVLRTRDLNFNCIWLLATCNLVFTPYCVELLYTEYKNKNVPKSVMLCETLVMSW